MFSNLDTKTLVVAGTAAAVTAVAVAEWHA